MNSEIRKTENDVREIFDNIPRRKRKEVQTILTNQAIEFTNTVGKAKNKEANTIFEDSHAKLEKSLSIDSSVEIGAKKAKAGLDAYMNTCAIVGEIKNDEESLRKTVLLKFLNENDAILLDKLKNIG